MTYESVCCASPFVVDPEHATVRRGDKLVNLTPIELDLLCYLIARRGVTVTREELLRAMWGRVEASHVRTVDIHVASLRRKLEQDSRHPRFILTVRGVGYEFRG